MAEWLRCELLVLIIHLVVTLLHLFNIPGQFSVLQSSVSCRWPGQSFPPCKGNGLSQKRCLFRFPLPQPLSHTVQEDHSPHAPSRGTVTKRINTRINIKNCWFWRLLFPWEQSSQFVCFNSCSSLWWSDFWQISLSGKKNTHFSHQKNKNPLD